jgi:hypothetical protein
MCGGFVDFRGGTTREEGCWSVLGPLECLLNQ